MKNNVTPSEPTLQLHDYFTLPTATLLEHGQYDRDVHQALVRISTAYDWERAIRMACRYIELSYSQSVRLERQLDEIEGE